ncbi:class I SAM-dependent methyltransferase [Nocardia sp. NPDC052566]|uniref:class I SAM-dependent methyltransferase n=1 Tax=Nocardia sp. NPDC052566 TaxID=3364330 RepID=UPI0037C6DAD7
MLVADADRWNVNIHFHDLLVDAVSGADAVLDVGCGEGMLARRLRTRSSAVTGIDLDEPGIDSARAQSPDGEIDYVHADFLDHPFEPASFDGIVSVATLHHMDNVAALTRMKELLRPGGTLAVVGLARNELPADALGFAGSIAAFAWYRTFRKRWDHPSPIVWPPPQTYRQVREIAEGVLPGVRFRRYLMPRYSIVWTK